MLPPHCTPRLMLSPVSARGVGHARGPLRSGALPWGEDKHGQRLAVGHQRCLWAVISLPSGDSPRGRPSCSGDAPLTPRLGIAPSREWAIGAGSFGTGSLLAPPGRMPLA